MPDAAVSTDCRKCRLYDARDRWCLGAEQVVRNPTAVSCRHYDGPRDEDEEPAAAPPTPENEE